MGAYHLQFLIYSWPNRNLLLGNQVLSTKKKKKKKKKRKKKKRKKKEKQRVKIIEKQRIEVGLEP